jgi:hypothetical protein
VLQGHLVKIGLQGLPIFAVAQSPSKMLSGYLGVNTELSRLYSVIPLYYIGVQSKLFGHELRDVSPALSKAG